MMKMNLKEGRGLVPIYTGDQIKPYTLVEFPARDKFDGMFHKSVNLVTLDKYWNMLKYRTQGSTLADAGKAYGLSRERVRQIEAKFLRKMRFLHSLETSSNID
jgi:hypothetical protein